MAYARLRTALAVFLTLAAVALGTGAAAGTARADAPPPGKPAFQLPFACGTAWRLDTWGHDPAVDIVAEGNPGSDGRPVYASAPGTVSAAYVHPGSGNTIQINHGNGWFTAYYHLQEAPDRFVGVGRQVTGATRIGSIGTSGAANGWAHLHYEQRYRASGDFTYESDRVPVHFDGVGYSGAGSTWPSVTSRNCATSQPWDCPAGFVCFYSGTGGTGTVCKTDVNTPASPCGLRRSFFNNGTEQPGYDHAYVTFAEGGSQCLHFGWAEGHGDFPSGGRTVTSVRWGGECP
ncbi:peptidoglycan DD-metalloendopeptidase family protein [Streptomyces sp. NPDC101115]|uniref:peptidoglycan DD-metalloendopeptidase family protein n=1 Tax=Streptomyces sp. NPDC101115 TaxID=3366106 RepID=UPI003824B799